VVESDVLKVDFAALARERWACPSCAWSATCRTTSPAHPVPPAAARGAVEDQHFMLQKEVVDRMVAAPATSDYGRLSVMLQWRYAMEDVLFVPPESFDPPPRVDSAVVRMVPLREPRPVDEKLLSELVQVAFSQRRKILRNTLGKWLEEKGFGGTSTCSGGPRKCRWRSTWRCARRSRPDQMKPRHPRAGGDPGLPKKKPRGAGLSSTLWVPRLRGDDA
jgi:16S rRNA (adenine1518-N6/adenine1519-N6)-dimethyltransferase